MLIHEKKINNIFTSWMIANLFLVFTIIIVGGLTRLTNSGLSITEWELFNGILPPLNNDSWLIYFNLYKEIPQYKILNFNMSLKEFKIIFYWEYSHRIIGRIIGLFFLIPLIIFYFTNKINKKYLNISYLIFLLILLQGIIGWYMVKSGLVDNVTVSHYRLSMHLCLALIIISTIFWLICNLINNKYKKFFNFKKKNISFLLLIFLILTQIILGAFVSGLDAGKIYQTWPLMNEAYFPEDVTINRNFDLLNFNNQSLVQFYHRNLAYVLTVYIIIISCYIYMSKLKRLYLPINLVLLFLLLQIILGIFTLVSGLNIYLASAHQICSVLLVFTTLNLYYFYIK
jgi:heme a synthase